MFILKKSMIVWFLLLLIPMGINAESIANKTVVWDKDKVLESINYRKSKELKSFLSVATKEQLNKEVHILYDGGKASLLGTVMDIMFQDKEFKSIVNLMIEKGSNVDGIENESLKPFLDFALDYNPKLAYTKGMKENGKSYLKKALYYQNPSVKLVKYSPQKMLSDIFRL